MYCIVFHSALSENVLYCMVLYCMVWNGMVLHSLHCIVLHVIWCVRVHRGPSQGDVSSISIWERCWTIPGPSWGHPGLIWGLRLLGPCWGSEGFPRSSLCQLAMATRPRTWCPLRGSEPCPQIHHWAAGVIVAVSRAHRSRSLLSVRRVCRAHRSTLES